MSKSPRSEWVEVGPRLDEVREMFREYQAELGIDLCFQGFEQELASLPGKYAPPSGAILLLVDPQPIACGALWNLGNRICELKRLYVRPSHRGQGLGRRLTLELMNRAPEIGYERVRLDTLRRLEPAGRLYRSLGFEEIQPYNYNPEPDIVYYERALGPRPSWSPSGDGQDARRPITP